jgi:hypothetical protein
MDKFLIKCVVIDLNRYQCVSTIHIIIYVEQESYTVLLLLLCCYVGM